MQCKHCTFCSRGKHPAKRTQDLLANSFSLQEGAHPCLTPWCCSIPRAHRSCSAPFSGGESGSVELEQGKYTGSPSADLEAQLMELRQVCWPGRAMLAQFKTIQAAGSSEVLQTTLI